MVSHCLRKKMGNQDGPGQPPKRQRQGRGRGATVWGRRCGRGNSQEALLVEDGEKQEDGGDGGLRGRGQTTKRPRIRSRTGANSKEAEEGEDGERKSEV